MKLDQAVSLERVGDTLYIGFNDDLTLISFPKLVVVEGALIIEGNPRLLSLAFPLLERVGKYIHIHDNGQLVDVAFPHLVSVGGELSLQEAPLLKSITVGRTTAHTSATALHVDGEWPQVFVDVHPNVG
jgi:hypothetical protein